MILSHKEIENIMVKKWSGIGPEWPDLTRDRIWPRGKLFKSFTDMEELTRVVKTCSVRKKYHWVKRGFECEFFATQLMSAVWDYQYSLEIRQVAHEVSEAVPWFFGLALCLKYNGQRGNDNLNIAMVKKDIALVCPQTDQIWMANKHNDYPYFILR